MENQMFDLAGKVVLVTGAGRNIGAGIARAAASQGAMVVVNDYHADRADQTVDQIRSAGGDAIAAAFDVTDREVVATAFEKVATIAGPVDVLVNNAGTGGPHGPMTMGPFVDSSP